MSALRTRVAVGMSREESALLRRNNNLIPDADRLLVMSEAAMAVIAKDRAARLEARMPEIEAAIVELRDKQSQYSHAIEVDDVNGDDDSEAWMETCRVRVEDEVARLLALIREAAE